jgi:hypothetical protein
MADFSRRRLLLDRDARAIISSNRKALNSALIPAPRSVDPDCDQQSRPKAFPFLRLPAEIRCKIYKMVVYSAYLDMWHSGGYNTWAIRKDMTRRRNGPVVDAQERIFRRYANARVMPDGKVRFEQYYDRQSPSRPNRKPQRFSVLLTSRQVYLEAIPIIYQDTEFTFYYSDWLEDVPSLSPEQLLRRDLVTCINSVTLRLKRQRHDGSDSAGPSLKYAKRFERMFKAMNRSLRDFASQPLALTVDIGPPPAFVFRVAKDLAALHHNTFQECQTWWELEVASGRTDSPDFKEFATAVENMGQELDVEVWP